ncbi:hypothetical protein [Enhygromyxa salina]|uniref:Uncharacterized protein n=1 Tax=Enhygromyxa salina TaxID=215803 RepID=A0A2S9XL63_9BACT|nr:hypothetical protein [Enhygromyxa salina]PRP93624.1 hypothetical protein ENSA7_80520 [Enhygromyxa salina]
MSSTELERHDRAVISPAGKVLISTAWVLGTSVPSWILAVCKVGLHSSCGTDASIVILPMLWLVCIALTSSFHARMLGHVDEVQPSLEPAPELHHLPRACAQFVNEAAAIRANLDEPHDALARAWQLAGEVDRARPEIRVIIEQYGATLDAVKPLLEARMRRGRGRLSNDQLAQRLAAVLSAFEDALRCPSATTFR